MRFGSRGASEEVKFPAVRLGYVDEATKIYHIPDWNVQITTFHPQENQNQNQNQFQDKQFCWWRKSSILLGCNNLQRRKSLY